MREANERLYKKGRFLRSSFSIPDQPKLPEKVYVWVVLYSTERSMDLRLLDVYSSEVKANDAKSKFKRPEYYYVIKREVL